jgi:hypothetical protein
MTLPNFLSSIRIRATKPFILNDWIKTNIEGYEVSGTVKVCIYLKGTFIYKEYSVGQ